MIQTSLDTTLVAMRHNIQYCAIACPRKWFLQETSLFPIHLGSPETPEREVILDVGDPLSGHQQRFRIPGDFVSEVKNAIQNMRPNNKKGLAERARGLGSRTVC